MQRSDTPTSERCGLRRALLHTSRVLLAIAPLHLLTGCLDRPLGAPEPVTTNVLTIKVSQDGVDTIDLLFMIDNSTSMSDKQAILETAVPDLVDRLVNPVCVDDVGGQYPAAPPNERCPDGQRREFPPVTDINIGVISSSLGDAGANDYCQQGDTVDGARLLGTLPRASTANTNAQGFLTWRKDTQIDEFKRDFQRLVRSVGEAGCGWESSLEAWYRFLIDPVPYAELERVACDGETTGRSCVAPVRGADGAPLLDEELLAQRAAFLRPNSLVAIVMLTDENDCSIRPGGPSWRMGTSNRTMFSGSAACANDPTDPCCYPCAQTGGAPAGCEWAHTTCEETDSHPENLLPQWDDFINLRCFDQKRRFGFDFLHPTSRYVNALSKPRLCPSNADLEVDDCPGAIVDNPLFSSERTPNNVFLAGIVGVPWQHIQSTTDAQGAPLPQSILRFKTAAELSSSDWRRIVGEPSASPPLAPSAPLMNESARPRPGVVVGGPNGREYDTLAESSDGLTATDLQYACIFPLPESRNCADIEDGSCDCSTRSHDRPLCEVSPGQSQPEPLQHWAKAYPGLRHLEVLQGYGENSIVASICARNVTDASRPDFGYRPAIASIVDRLEEQLARRCLPRRLEVRSDESVACTLVEARPASGGCECDPTLARSAPAEQVASSVRRQLASTPGSFCPDDDPGCNTVCLCELKQIVDEPALSACRNDLSPPSAEGWCYVADTAEQSIGNPELVKDCPPTERRLLRFVGQGLQNGAVTVISCLGQSFAGD